MSHAARNRSALAAMILFMTAAQVAFKYAGLRSSGESGITVHTLLNPWLHAGLAASALGFVCWFITLRAMPLSAAYPWTALIYLLTPLAAAGLFGEVLPPGFLLGVALIVIGLFIINGVNGKHDTR
ncbi:EamA family transporter [Stenotrophomonas sp. GD03908]|nr:MULTISPECIES: EamA family transporter [Stenotrophomonas]MBH1481998.1 EamA family transporter [Stenotrophomonas maltophilia]MCU1062979.1 EamA family transporter [Stenotrophomonas maltophilia]MDH0979821.1 EamA family transporter [Stenotrophomonas sp. GD03908]MDQ7294817.1 EamA family transporter [Stenotrophomonas sp. Sm0041]